MNNADTKYSRRRAALAVELGRRGLAAVMISDFEHGRDSSLRYLCGQPSDAMLVVDAKGASVLIAWDINMAKLLGDADHVLPYTDFGRQASDALRAALELLNVPQGSKVAIPASTPYPDYIDLVQALEAFDLVCERSGVDSFIREMRARKDTEEIELYRRIASYTDQLMDMVEKEVSAGMLPTSSMWRFFWSARPGNGRRGNGLRDACCRVCTIFRNSRLSVVYKWAFCQRRALDSGFRCALRGLHERCHDEFCRCFACSGTENDDRSRRGSAPHRD